MSLSVQFSIQKSVFNLGQFQFVWSLCKIHHLRNRVSHFTNKVSAITEFHLFFINLKSQVFVAGLCAFLGGKMLSDPTHTWASPKSCTTIRFLFDGFMCFSFSAIKYTINFLLFCKLVWNCAAVQLCFLQPSRFSVHYLMWRFACAIYVLSLYEWMLWFCFFLLF